LHRRRRIERGRAASTFGDALLWSLGVLDLALTVALLYFFMESGDPIYLFAAGFPIAAAVVFAGRALA